MRGGHVFEFRDTGECIYEEYGLVGVYAGERVGALDSPGDIVEDAGEEGGGVAGCEGGEEMGDVGVGGEGAGVT